MSTGARRRSPLSPRAPRARARVPTPLIRHCHSDGVDSLGLKVRTGDAVHGLQVHGRLGGNRQGVRGGRREGHGLLRLVVVFADGRDPVDLHVRLFVVGDGVQDRDAGAGVGLPRGEGAALVWRLVAVGGGWRRLVLGDRWLVAVGSGWQLAVGRRWRLAAVGGWRLVAVGGWRLVAVGG